MICTQVQVFEDRYKYLNLLHLGPRMLIWRSIVRDQLFGWLLFNVTFSDISAI